MIVLCLLLLVTFSIVENNYVFGAMIQDLNFPQETEIKTIFNAISEVGGFNLIVGSRVSGEMSIRLTNIDVMDAIDSVASGHGLDYYYDQETNVVFVDSTEVIEDRFRSADRKVEVFKLENSEADDVKNSISFLLDDSLMDINQRQNSIIVSTYEEELKKLESLIKGLDKQKKQVMIQARIQAVSHDQLNRLGVDWSLSEDDGASRLEFSGPATLNFDYEDSFDLNRFMVNLNMLEEAGESELLANPRISTIDGESARIHIGDQIPVITEDDGDRSLSFEDAGISLTIDPRIVEGDKIEIDVEPQISSVTEYVNLGSYEYPVIDTTEAETRIRVTDGKTAVIGGLIQEDVFMTEEQIPLLGDIPVLGRLFKSENQRAEKQELLIFITPKIIDKDESEREVSDELWERRVDEVLESFKEELAIE